MSLTGVKISSHNLSGLTGNVTFIPYSGGSISLGNQTVPFGYISEYPYGLYEINIYTHTYTITVPPPMYSTETISILGTQSGSTTWSIVTLNYSGNTATLLDLGIEQSSWVINDVYPLTERGYVYIFYNDVESQNLVIFTNAANEIIGQYSGSTNIQFDSSEGRIFYVIDPDNGVIKYSNGVNYYSALYDTNLTFAGDVSYADGATADNTFMLRFTSGTTYTDRLVSNGTIIDLNIYDSSIIEKRYFMYNDGQFFVETTYNSSGYTQIKIYNTTGGTLQTIALPSDMYNAYEMSFYGNNKLWFILFNENNDTEYLIYQYNHNTETITSTTHPKINYPSFRVYSRQNSYVNYSTNDSFFIELYSFSGSNNGYGMAGVLYMDILYVIGDETSFGNYVFENSGLVTKYIAEGNNMGNTYFNLCDVDDGNMSLLKIGINGGTITPFEQLSNITNIYGITSFGSYFFIALSISGGIKFYVTSESGVVISQSVIGDPTMRFDFNTVYISDGSTNGWYFNPTVGSFTEIGYYDNTYATSNNPYWTLNYQSSGTMLLRNNSTRLTRILTQNSISDPFYTPATSTDLLVFPGKDKFLYVYTDINNFVNMTLYDFNGNIIQTLGTEYLYGDIVDSIGVKDRYLVTIHDTIIGMNIIYFITPVSIQTTILDDSSYARLLNDYIWIYND